MEGRDLVGYGKFPPNPNWPNGARLALQFVLNYEEGGEKSVLYGDSESESFLLEQPTAPFGGARNFGAESQYEYGSRAGFWRLHRLFTERQLPLTVFGVAQALDQNPQAVTAMKEADWEIASHGLRWLRYGQLSPDEERVEIAKAIDLHVRCTGERPLGWYTGARTAATRDLLVQQGGFLYDSNDFSDDLPFWTRVGGTNHLTIPYALDTNDMRYLIPFGYQSESFSSYLIQAFDLLRREAAFAPKMMNVGLHNRIVGRPARAADFERFLDHVAGSGDVWVARRVDIARHWHQFHAPQAS